MCASAAAIFSSTLPPTHSVQALCRVKLSMNHPITFLSRRRFRNSTLRFSAATASRSFDEVSWTFPEDMVSDECRGWAVVESPVPKKREKTGFQKVLVVGAGTSVILLLAGIAHFSLAWKGVKLPFRNPLHILHHMLTPSAAEIDQIPVVEPDASNGDVVPFEAREEAALPASIGEVASMTEKTQPRILSFAVDSTQEEAISLLKKLKIIEDDVKGHELCCRREYARWLVRASLLLERNPKHKIVPPDVLSASIVTAYEDVLTNDPDFISIQAIAETGIASSKLSRKDTLENHEHINFHPERLISRHDLIDWRAQLEYDFASVGTIEISKTKLDIMDVREVSLELSPGFYMDLLAGERSLFRKVFGLVKRFQPKKPATKGEAAVVLTSGRMAEAISLELFRIEAEEFSKKVASEQIKRELLDGGELQRYWDDKMEEERTLMLQSKQLFDEALIELEEEKSIQQRETSENLKKKTAIDCQKQLLKGLELDVYELSKRLEREQEEQIVEEETLRVVSNSLQVKKEGILDAKSWLEAEIEALRILRSWIEDEAKKSQARALVLEEVGRRWRWSGQS